MKKYIVSIISGLVLGGMAFAATAGIPISVPSSPSGGYFLVSTSTGAYIATTTNPAHFGSVFATSTTATSTLPYLSSTGFSTTWLCLTGDICRTTWPSGGSGITDLGSGWATTTAAKITFGTTTLSFNGLTVGQTIVPATPSTGNLIFTPTITGTLNNAGLTNSTISGVALGSSLNSATFNNGGAGSASGATYNGSGALTVSYNTIGAVPTTRNINTNYPLQGGGALSGDLTLTWGGLGTSTPFSNNQFVYTNNAGSLVTAASSSLSLPNTALQNSTISGVALGSNLSSLTMNNGGSGAASGSTYNGSGAVTLSYNTLGAVPTGRQLTLNGTANQITSSVGAQDLSADRTWTFSLPGQVNFPNTFYSLTGTTTLFAAASSTIGNFVAGTVTATSSLTLSGLTQVPLYANSLGVVGSAGTGVSGNCVKWGANNTLADQGATCGSGSGGIGDPFTHVSWGGQTTSATTSVMQAIQTVAASSSVGSFSVGSLTATSSITNVSVKSALVLNSSTGLEGSYGGASACSSHNFVTTISAAGATTCGTDSISGVNLGSNLFNHSTNSTLSGTSYNGSAAVSDWGINLANANTWTAAQLLSYTATTSVSGELYAKALDAPYLFATSSTATSTFNGGILGGFQQLTAGMYVSGGNVGIATATPYWPLTISNATKPQLTLTDTSLTQNAFNFRAEGGILAISSSSAATYATATPSALEINSNTIPSLSVGSTTVDGTLVNGMFIMGSNGENGTSTLQSGKFQMDLYNSAGTRECAYVVGTSWVISAGSCNR